MENDGIGLHAQSPLDWPFTPLEWPLVAGASGVGHMVALRGEGVLWEWKAGGGKAVYEVFAG